MERVLRWMASFRLSGKNPVGGDVGALGQTKQLDFLYIIIIIIIT